LVTALKIDWTKSWTFGILPCLSSTMFFNMYSPAWRHYLARAILPRRSTSVFPIYFRFLIFYLYLLPLPHLLLVFSSVSSSFIGIYFHFLIFYLYRFIFKLYRFIF
jgi:hypothetical protein